MQLPKGKENTSRVGEEQDVGEAVRGMYKMTRLCERTQTQQQQTERKQKEAAKTMNVVLSSSFCRLTLFPTPKYTITSY